MSYLFRDPAGTYYFRRVIPPALQGFMPAPWTGKSAWKRSLRTKDPAVAKRSAARFLTSCLRDFELAERAQRGEPIALPRRQAAMPPSGDIEADVYASLMAADDHARAHGDARKQHQTVDERAAMPHLEAIALGGRWTEEDFFEGYGQELETLHADFARALARSNPTAVRTETRDYLMARGVSFDSASSEYHEAALAVLKAHVRAYEAKLERQGGKVIPTPEPAKVSRGPLLSEAYADWKAGSGTRGSRKPADNTLVEAEYAVRRLTEWHGDIRLGDLNREKAVAFRQALASVPTRLTGELRRLPLPDLLKRDLTAFAPQSAGTINKSLTLLAAIVVHAEKAGKLDAVPGFKNPFGPGIKLPLDARAGEQRHLFETADLKALFATGVFRNGDRPAGGGGEAAFWLPLLGLLSGARQGELAQLRVADLAQDPESGIWFIDIDTTGGRKVKTAASRRKVPVHPELARIGLLRYRQGLLDAGADPSSPLWPHVEADRTGRQNGPWSKWFNRYLRDRAGVEDRGKVFHSFRHTFKRMARDAGIMKDVHDAFTGHVGGEDAGQAYGRGFGLRVLAEAMARVEVPEAVRGLSWEPGELARTRRRRPAPGAARKGRQPLKGAMLKS